MIDKILEIMPLITALASGCVIIYKLVFKKDDKRLRSYYSEILQPYIVAYKENEKINTIEFLEGRLRRDNDNIPKYIFCLLDNKNGDTLKKVLIDDYLELYPNDTNKILRYSRMFKKIWIYGIFTIALVALILGDIYVVMSVFSILSNIITLEVECIIYLKIIAIGLILIGISFFGVILGEMLNKDIYTLKKTKIEKLISKKEKSYDKEKEKYIL